ncbi:MAG: enoyl-CoA hydratase/isomerase family protein [Acidimicrobiia bacterium]|nr:enoyl-CoA hydratase/isomerase family protein [Acidimicrobiia bacterium]
MTEGQPARLTIERDAGVALVTLRRPERRNALDDRLLVDELGGAWAELRDDPDTAVVVVTGEGSAFCAGADLEHCSGFRRPEVADAEDFTRSTLEPVVALHRLPQLTIAAVNGVAVGAGFGMALACDLRILAPTARFMSPFVRMGLVPDYGLSWLLPRLVPMHAALDIMLTGRFVEAAEALELGLAARIVEDPLADAMDYARRVATGPKRAMRVTKQALYRALDLDIEEAVLIEEARSQAIALLGPEFPERYAAWRGEITGSSG